MKLCTACGYQGEPKKFTKGSFPVEIMLWLFFFIPGLIYSLWRQASKYEGCSKCGSATLIPLDSPVAKQMLAKMDPQK